MKADVRSHIINWVANLAGRARNITVLSICLLIALSAFSGAAHAQVRLPCDTSCGGGNTTDPAVLLARGRIPATRGNGPGVSAGGAKRIAGSSSFSYTVPLFNISGRGIDLNLNLHYNSFVWTQSGSTLTLNADRDNPSIGFRLDYGFIEFADDGSAGLITDSTGAKHTLSIAFPQPNQTAGILWNTTDSTYTQVFVPAIAGNPVVATLKSGARIFYQGFTANPSQEFRPYSVEDTNGNTVTISYMNANNLSLQTVTDTLGRNFQFFYDAATSTMLQCVTTGFSCNSPAPTYTFSWNQNYQLNFAFNRLTGTLKSGITVLSVLTGVTRPDSTSVKFNYGDWAIVNNVQESTSTGNVRYSTVFNFPAASAGALQFNPTYTQQTVNDGVQSSIWNFLATSNAAGLVTSLATTDPVGTTNTTTFSANGDWQDGLPIQTQITSPGYLTMLCIPIACPPPPTIWRTTKRAWTSDNSTSGVNPRPATDTLILEDNTQSQVVYASYDVNGNPTDVQQYDFGPSPHGPLLRETVSSFPPLANNILNRPSDIQVKDGSGNVISHSAFRYDETAPSLVTPNPVGHDPNFAPVSNVRGNLTSRIDYADTTHSVTSTFTFDSLGNLLTSKTGSGPVTSRQFSSATNFGYPDSVSVGPSGSQLTTILTYEFASGVLLNRTDPNGQKTSYGYDLAHRLKTLQTPDLIVVTNSYDDTGAFAAVTTSSSANGLVSKATLDGLGRTLSQQVFDGLGSTIPISTQSNVYDAAGFLSQSSNPYPSGGTPLYTVYAHDPLGRVTATAPPPSSAGLAQNSYQAIYSGISSTFSDPTGKQRTLYKDALGRIVRVDEPGLVSGQAASGSLTVSGTDLSVPSTLGSNGATAGGATLTIQAVNTAVDGAGSIDRSTQVLTHAATASSVSLTLGGHDGTSTFSTTFCGINGCRTTTRSSPDTGSIKVTIVAGGTTIGPFAAPYTSAADTAGGLATTLAANLPANSFVTATNSASGVVTFTSKTASSAVNSYTIAVQIASNCVDSDTISCIQSWTTQLSGPSLAPTPAVSANFTGGSDNVFQTVYDTGSVVAWITANGTTFSKSSNYSQTSTASSIANDLYNKFVTDTTFNSVVRVNPPGTGSVLQFTTVATGAGTNYPITTSAGTTSSNFAAGSTSFTISPAGNSSFVPGQNGILWDTGTVTATLTGFTTANVAPKQVSYGQGSNAASIAGLLAAQMHNDSAFPVDAVVTPPGSATIVFTARDQGADGNSYHIAVSGQTSQPASFTTASFPAVAVTLAGGVTPVPSFTPGTVLTTTYAYSNNQVVVHQGQQTRTYVFDGLGRMTSSTVPETGYIPTTATYTDFGAPATITDPRQMITTFGYDPLNRIQTVSFSDGTPGLSYTYGAPGDPFNTGGRLATVQQKLANGTVVSADGYQYDVMGRETLCSKTIAGNLYNIGYLYNADGTLQKMTYPSGRTVNTTEDDIGRLAQIASNGTTVLSAISYNAANEVRNATYGNSMVAQYTYNDRLQLSKLTYGNAGATALSLSYDYGAGPNNGQILGITDNLTPSQSTSYIYDELGRLKTAQTNDLTSANTWKLKYGYDRYGNRLEQVPQAGTAAMPLSETPVDPTTNRVTTLAYDNAGNVVNDGLHSYAFNVLNQLTKVDGSATPYTYDAAGQRIIKNGTVYIYSGGQVLAEYASGSAATSPSVEYIYGGAGLFASVVLSGTMTYYYRDHLSNRLLASSTGATTGTLSTFPFGESRLQSGAATKWQFTTYERDNAANDSGLDYANARYYSSRVGRFMSMDPLTGSFANPQSLNRFSYVANDPVNMVDPSGMAGGNWTCLLNEHGDCFGGDYSGLSWMNPMASWGGMSSILGSSSCFADGQSVDCGVVSALLRLGGIDLGSLPSINSSIQNGDAGLFVHWGGDLESWNEVPNPEDDVPVDVFHVWRITSNASVEPSKNTIPWLAAMFPLG